MLGKSPPMEVLVTSLRLPLYSFVGHRFACPTPVLAPGRGSVEQTQYFRLALFRFVLTSRL